MATELEKWKLKKAEVKKAHLKKCTIEKVLNLSKSKKCKADVRDLMKDVLILLEDE